MEKKRIKKIETLKSLLPENVKKDNTTKNVSMKIITSIQITKNELLRIIEIFFPSTLGFRKTDCSEGICTSERHVITVQVIMFSWKLIVLIEAL